MRCHQIYLFICLFILKWIFFLFMPGSFLRLEFRNALSHPKPNAKNGSSGNVKLLLCKTLITFCPVGIYSTLSFGFFSFSKCEELSSTGRQ